jgi:hypothetical protein
MLDFITIGCVGRTAPHTTVFVLDAAAHRYRFLILDEFYPWLTDKTHKPSPQTPLPTWERGFESTYSFLTPLLPLWEKGLGDEGKKVYQSIKFHPLATAPYPPEYHA